MMETSKVKTTYSDYFELINTAKVFLEIEIVKASGNSPAITGRKTKLGYAIEKFFKANRNIQAVYNDDLNDIRLDHALTVAVPSDPATRVIVHDEKGGLQFTALEAKKRNRKITELGSKEIEVIPCYASEVPTLLDIQLEVFKGFVIDPAYTPPTTAPAADLKEETEKADSPPLNNDKS